MAKQFFKLTGDYEGKRVRRLKQFGRVVFYRVFFDPDEIVQIDYWLIAIKNFSEEHDRPIIRHISAFGNGTFRFAHLREAEERFEQLCALSEYAADEIKRQNSIARAREHAQSMLATGKMGSKNLQRKKPPSGIGTEQAREVASV